MTRTTKIISFSLILILVLFLAVFGWFTLKKAPGMLSEALSKKLKTTVSVERITVGWNTITIHDLKIANISPSILPHAFQTKKITIKASLLNYLKDKIKIETILIENNDLDLEFDSIKSPKGNWTQLIGNLKSETSSSNKKASVTIDTLKLTNIDTTVIYKTNPEKIIRLPRIDNLTFRNISTQDGLPLSQITNSVLGEMLKAVFAKENLKNMVEELFNPKDTLDNFLSPFKKLIP